MQPMNVRRMPKMMGAVALLCLAGACGGASNQPAASNPDVWAEVADRDITRDVVEKAYRASMQPGAARRRTGGTTRRSPGR